MLVLITAKHSRPPNIALGAPESLELPARMPLIALGSSEGHKRTLPELPGAARSSKEGNGVRSPEQAAEFIQRLKYNGMTPLGTSLEDKVIKPFVTKPLKKKALRKPVLVSRRRRPM